MGNGVKSQEWLAKFCISVILFILLAYISWEEIYEIPKFNRDRCFDYYLDYY